VRQQFSIKSITRKEISQNIEPEKMDTVLLENSPFHNPVLKLTDENKRKKVLHRRNSFILSTIMVKLVFG